MFDLLTIHCKYSEDGCGETLNISDVSDHQKSCQFSKGKRNRGSYNKMKLYYVSQQYSKRGRKRCMKTCQTSLNHTMKS